MDTEDLRKFLVVAEHSNLQTASKVLSQTAGALSKVIKRLETKLNCQLFDRVGRHIVLNRQGQKFLLYASNLLHETDQVISEFTGNAKRQTINISGPSVLLQHGLPKIMEPLLVGEYELNIRAVWEGEALSHVKTGQAHLSLVTAEAVGNQHNDLVAIDLLTTRFQLVASKHHPLMQNNGQINSLTPDKLVNYAFACPAVSHFCGIKRGVGSDGWRDDEMTRTIGFQCDDFSVLLSLVQAGRALAYLPDFVARDHGFGVVEIKGYVQRYEELVQLLYKPSLASGWLNHVVGHFR